MCGTFFIIMPYNYKKGVCFQFTVGIMALLCQKRVGNNCSSKQSTLFTR